jgi:hypothetical protein
MADTSETSDISENRRCETPKFNEVGPEVQVEPLNLSIPDIWPSKVFVPSDPIPIKVTLANEDPFIGPPSCMLDTYMREAWEKHNLEKQDAPEDKLPTKEVDTEKMETVEEVDEPMEEGVNKKVEELKATAKKKDESSLFER